MKRCAHLLIVCLFFGYLAIAQEADNTPATIQDIQTYFETVHSHDAAKKMMEGMLKPMHGMIHDQYLKNQTKLPANYEELQTKQLDDMFRNMPIDEMMQASIPVYQRHFTKGDVNALLAFYSSPTGQKLLKDLPAIMSESMEAMRPIISRYIEEMQNKLQQETEEMITESEKKQQTQQK